jgi:hypothetical protein
MLGDLNENVLSASDKVHLREIVVTFHHRLPATIAPAAGSWVACRLLTASI